MSFENEFDIVDAGGIELVDEQPAAPAASQPAAGQPAAPAPADMQAYDIVQPDASVNVLPDYASGMDKTTPINKSPLTIEERFKLSLGNDKGREQFLKQRFEEVSKDKDGDLIVKDKGMWHRVDGKAFSDVDPWTATKGILSTAGSLALLTIGDEKSANDLASSNPVSKELMSDYAEILPTATAMTLGAAAGLATGGASTVAQAAGAGLAAAVHETARTSLGRLEGTYEAKPEEQLMDIGFETVLNMAGVLIPKGVRPTASWVGEKVPALAKAYGSMSEASREAVKGMQSIFAQVAGFASGTGDALETVIEHGDEVAKTMKAYGRRFPWQRNADYANQLTRSQIEQVGVVADKAESMLSEVYRGKQAQLLKSVGNDFSVSVDDTLAGVYKQAVGEGTAVMKLNGKALSMVEAMDEMAKAGGKLPKGATVALKPRHELIKGVQQGTRKDAAGVAFDDDAYDMLQQFWRQVDGLSKVKTVNGRAGANQILQINQVMDDLTYKLSTKARDSGVNEIQRRMAAYHETIRGSVEGAFDKHGSKGLFKGLMESYSTMKGEMYSVLKAARTVDKGDTQAYEQLLGRLMSRDSKNVTVKNAFSNVLQNAEKYGAKSVATIRDAQKQIRILQAAKDLNPVLKPGFIGQGSQTVAVGSVLANAVASGTVDPAVPAVAAAGALATSPRVALHASDLVRTAWAGKQWLEKGGADAAKYITADPARLNAFVSAIVHTPTMENQVKEHLLSPIKGTPQ